MMQLSFQPAFDVVHSAFRAVRLLPMYSELGGVTVDLARILDFYLLFPFRLTELTLKREHLWVRRVGKGYENTRPYGIQPDAKTLFERMSPIQFAAFENLALLKLIDREQYEGRILRPTAGPIPEALQARVNEINAQEADLMNAVKALASDYPVVGPDSLKARSALLEYRYDAAV